MANLEKYKSLLAEVFDTDVANVKEDFSKETVDNWEFYPPAQYHSCVGRDFRCHA